jgi:hypothetical protein
LKIWTPALLCVTTTIQRFAKLGEGQEPERASDEAGGQRRLGLLKPVIAPASQVLAAANRN